MTASTDDTRTGQAGATGARSESEPLPRRCTNHPDRETWIACGRCERPFCTACLVQTPAGQRCYECAGMRRDHAQRAARGRLLRAAGVAALGGAIVSLLGGILYVALGGMIAGNVAGQLASSLITRQTRRTLFPVTVVLLLVAAYAGFVLARAAFAMSRGVPPVAALVEAAVTSAFTFTFWLYAAIALIVAGVRMR
jgi:hypothetical protein